MPDASNTNNIDFTLRDIGPFQEGLHFRHDSKDNNLKIAIYATNGSGKTFISRCFHLLDTNSSGEKDYYPWESLVSLGKTCGRFRVQMTNSERNNTCDIQIDRSNKSINAENNKIVYHVFNSDYVKRQFMEKDFIIDGNITGKIIVGEENTKTATLKEELAKIKEQNDRIKTDLTHTIDIERERIKEEYGIKPNLLSWQNITFDNVVTKKIQNCNSTLDILIESYNKLKDFGNVEDNYENIPKLPELQDPQIDISDLNRMLQRSYERAFITESFLEKIKRDQFFIKKGLELTENNMCPYCGQSLSGADELIAAYNKFFDRTQDDISNQLNSYKKLFTNLNINLDILINSSSKYTKQFNELKNFFPSTKDISLMPIVLPEKLRDLIKSCITLIDEKIQDITKSLDDLSQEYILLLKDIKHINNQIIAFNSNIERINNAKSSIILELRGIKNQLCSCTMNDLIVKNCSAIDIYNENIDKMVKIDEELRKLSSTISKKDLVYTTFHSLIKKYFGEKYTVERDTFSLQLNSVNIQNPSIVLSDGEKSIVAFCYYLANIHKKVSTKSDYNNLFLIIDDPISSMDFAYVYETAQIIKCLPEIVKNNRISFMIFTHNAEFINILEANNLVTTAYTFGHRDFEIKKLKGGLVSPYQEHLKDIFRIATGEIRPCHTTYNSIRHILEGIKYFMEPDNNSLDDFVAKQEVKSHKLFENNGHMKRVIQDMSHGRIRTEADDIYEDKTIDGCKELIEYMREKFPGQIEHIENRNAQS